MSTRARIFLRQNVIGLVALFVALGGTATALQGKNTVDSGDIKPGNVKNSDLAANSVDSSKVIDDSLTGADVDEGALGQVKNAAHAATADTATQAASATSAAQADNATHAANATQADSANTATNANNLDGLDSTAFLGATAAAGGDLTGNYPNPQLAPNSVTFAEISPNTVGADDISGVASFGAGTALKFCDDPTVGSGGAAQCGSNGNFGNFNIFFMCEDTGAARTAQLLIEDATDGETWALDSHGPNGAADATGLVAAAGSGDRQVLASAGPTANAHFQAGDYSALRANGTELEGEAGVGTNVFGHDCAATFSGLG